MRAVTERSVRTRPGAVGSDPERIDGRRLRSARSKDLVVGAILELLREGDPNPSAHDIAMRAGVSERTVFRHYDDLDQLFAAAVARQTRHISPLLDMPPTSGPRSERVAELVRRRSRLYEEVSPVRRAAMRHAPFQTVVRLGLDQLHALLRGQVEAAFEADLAGLEDERRGNLVEALDVSTSWAVWEVLRTDQDLDMARASDVLENMLTAVLLAALGPEES